MADVDSLGGYVKQYVVEPDMTRLASYGIDWSELGTALEDANLSIGANYLRRSGESYLVRADGRLRSVDQIATTVVAQRNGI
ncbi:efflux RND transporter permease subunit, partial [Escherichia coli]|uniref:efflux RND transporter permease subunit n=1 Tax=Escherichia coli TaxID=562 RepID=UPI0027D32B01